MRVSQFYLVYQNFFVRCMRGLSGLRSLQYSKYDDIVQLWSYEVQYVGCSYCWGNFEYVSCLMLTFIEVILYMKLFQNFTLNGEFNKSWYRSLNLMFPSIMPLVTVFNVLLCISGKILVFT